MKFQKKKKKKKIIIAFIADAINNGQILSYCNIDIPYLVSMCLFKFLLNSLSLIVFSCWF